MDKYLMAIDAGTGSVRAVIFDLRGGQVSCAAREWEHKEDPRYKGSMDFDYKFNWELACTCIRESIAQAGIRPEQVVGLSTTCMREGIVLYDKDLNEIWACANVDARSGDEAAALCSAPGNLELEHYKKSGQSFALDAIPRLTWVKNKLPEVYDRIRYVGMFNDWLILKLTGILAVEPSNGSTSGLFNLTTRDFDPSLAKACGIDRDFYPKSVECGTVIGNVSARAAEQTGLSVQTKVVVGGGDCQLGSIGVGVIAKDEAAIFGGSFWQYEYNTDRPIVDEKGRVRVNCHALPGMWQFEALAFKPGLVMRWFRDGFCQHEKELAQKTGRDPYDLMNEQAEKVPAGSNGIMCTFSDVMNFMCWKHASPTFTNFDLDPDKFSRYAFYRAILENTALVTRGHVELVKESTGNVPEYVVFGGGASKSPLWSQILASVLGIEVRVPKVKEATALGAALLAGYGLGIYPDLKAASRDLVAIEKIYSPDQKDHETYLKIYEDWKKIYKAQLDLSDAGLTRYMWAGPGI